MEALIREIEEIPGRARACLEASRSLELPRDVPYLGMGSSYFAALTLRYSGVAILPELASEYFHYCAKPKKPLGVLISQSGESSETVWCLDSFDKVVAITNSPSSTLARADNIEQAVDIGAGEEVASSTKTYVNTLILLYLGLGIDPSAAVQDLEDHFDDYCSNALSWSTQVCERARSDQRGGLFVLGSGPNVGTALQAALTLTETTKLPWIGMPLAQFDHGIKEVANDSVVVVLESEGPARDRSRQLAELLQSRSNALVITTSSGLEERLSPIPLIAQMNWLMYFLAVELEVGETFALGSKVTRFET